MIGSEKEIEKAKAIIHTKKKTFAFAERILKYDRDGMKAINFIKNIIYSNFWIENEQESGLRLVRLLSTIGLKVNGVTVRQDRDTGVIEVVEIPSK